MTGVRVQVFCILFLVLFLQPVQADAYDPLLLRAQASIFPKIILLDQDLSEKTHGDDIIINIVSSSADSSVANEFRDNILEKYKKRLGGKGLVVNVSTFANFKQKNPATAYIVMQGDEALFEKVVTHAVSNKRIVFSYSYTDLENNALISLHVKEKTYIYVSKSTVKKYGINFLPVFYKIIKIL